VNRIKSSIECLLMFFTLGFGGDQRKSLTAAIRKNFHRNQAYLSYH